MASLSWPWEPLEPNESPFRRLPAPLATADDGGGRPDEYAYDPYAEQDKTPSERMYDEANRDIEPRMEEWRAE